MTVRVFTNVGYRWYRYHATVSGLGAFVNMRFEKDGTQFINHGSWMPRRL